MSDLSKAWNEKYLSTPGASAMNDTSDTIAILKKEYNNPAYKDDRPALARELARLGALPPGVDSGIPINSPEAQSLLGQAEKERGALSRVAEAPPVAAPAPREEQPAQGALSAAMTQRPQREEVDFETMLNKYVPQDDSRSKYLALAAAFTTPTQTGSFGETVNNVANAMLQQKQQQQKLRAQYAPLIMQQIAAQQTREEQNMYRLEAQKQAQEAQRQALLAQQQGRVELANLNQAAANERAKEANASREATAAAERALRAQLAGDSAALQRDLAPAKDPQKPLPASALKMQQEALDAIGVSSSINSDLGAVEKQIENGKLKFGPVSNLINKGMNTLGASTEESRNFGSFTSTLERLRNESLRLNTGVQTDGDAQRAWNELFQNVNDTELVKQRLKEIKAINKRGAELQQLKIDGIRANYGHEPLDTSGQRNVPPALNVPTLPPADAIAAELARRAKLKGQ